MRLNLDLTSDQTLSLVNQANDVDKTVDEYVKDVLFERKHIPLHSSTNVLDLDNYLHDVIESAKNKIIEYESGFVFVKEDILPYARQVIPKEQVEVIDHEVISRLETDGVIKLWSNDNGLYQYIRN